eukprot:SAG11_NODE_6303_length_1342_cov_1.083669_2_plen_24_part_01
MTVSRYLDPATAPVSSDPYLLFYR